MRLLSYCGHSLMRKAFLSVFVVALVKLAEHWLGWEVISLNPLFSGLVAAYVFLMRPLGSLIKGAVSTDIVPPSARTCGFDFSDIPHSSCSTQAGLASDS